ncbi:MAG: hypothetical protein K0Q63_287 [Paenibacillus sp.]|jgi:hypothetical protein|nr:hypothetical protein [Paenibacillus sp.]
MWIGLGLDEIRISFQQMRNGLPAKTQPIQNIAYVENDGMLPRFSHSIRLFPSDFY